MKNFWAGKRVLVTGAHGFIGQHLCQQLVVAGAEVYAPTHYEFDVTVPGEVNCMFTWANPQIVIHLAANVGGIGYNQKYPMQLFRDNILMGVNVIDACAAWPHQVDKLVVMGTTCAYPKSTPVPFVVSALWNGYPEETNAAYGVAKRALLTMCQASRQQYGLNAIYLLLTNLYGPSDNFDPEHSHVIPAMIRKFIEARDSKAPSVTLWGDGSATRDFLYVEDCARGIMLATEKYNQGIPVNLGTGLETSIVELADIIKTLTDYTGFIKWDTSRPNGQPRRCLETLCATNEFGFISETTLFEGLLKTIRWYEEGGGNEGVGG
jgi:GDP-L-fucose synthase